VNIASKSPPRPYRLQSAPVSMRIETTTGSIEAPALCSSGWMLLIV